MGFVGNRDGRAGVLDLGSGKKFLAL